MVNVGASNCYRFEGREERMDVWSGIDIIMGGLMFLWIVSVWKVQDLTWMGEVKKKKKKVCSLLLTRVLKLQCSQMNPLRRKTIPSYGDSCLLSDLSVLKKNTLFFQEPTETQVSHRPKSANVLSLFFHNYLSWVLHSSEAAKEAQNTYCPVFTTFSCMWIEIPLWYESSDFWWWPFI